MRLAVVVGLLVATDAHAYCRTTSAPPADASYNAVQRGCWTAGFPVFWRNRCVGYSIQKDASRRVNYADAANLLSTAFTRWTGATCPTAGGRSSRVSIDVRDLGPVECATVEYANRDANQNVVILRDDTWPYKREQGVLGLVKATFLVGTGEITGADMELNLRDMDPIAVQDPVPEGAYDLLSVMTHEAGHFLGIAHSDVQNSTMYASYNVGSTFIRILSSDDIAGICDVYRPDGDRPVLDGKLTQGPTCDPTPRGGYASACQDGCSRVAPKAPPPGLGWCAIGLALVLRRASRRCSRSSSPPRTSR